MDETASIFDSLTPEQLAALLQGGTLQDQGSLLDEQIAQLLGSGTPHTEHTSPLGAGLGGLAEAIDGTANAFHVKALRGDRQKNLDAQQKLMGDFGALLRGPSQPHDVGAGLEHGLSPMAHMGAGVDRSPAMGHSYEIGERGDTRMMPELDIGALVSPSRNQPADPTAIVDDGSAGWGLDLSDPRHVSALIGVEPQPSLADASQTQVPDMTSLPPRREGRRPRAFAY